MKRMIALCAAVALCLSTLSGCAKPGTNGPTTDKEEKVDLAAFAQTVQENHEFSALERADPEDAEVGAVMLGNWYPGLTDLDLEQAEIYMPMISFSGGELALVQAKNAEDAAKVKEIFQARLDSKTTEGPGNYPEEVEMWQRSAKVVDHGNYVMLVNHGDSEAIVEEFNALFA